MRDSVNFGQETPKDFRLQRSREVTSAHVKCRERGVRVSRLRRGRPKTNFHPTFPSFTQKGQPQIRNHGGKKRATKHTDVRMISSAEGRRRRRFSRTGSACRACACAHRRTKTVEEGGRAVSQSRSSFFSFFLILSAWLTPGSNFHFPVVRGQDRGGTVQPRWVFKGGENSLPSRCGAAIVG